MKTVYLLFILLIALTNCIQQITHYSSYSLDTKDNYFYLSTWSYSSGYAYLYFEDRSYNLNYNSLEVCFTNTNPSSSSISSCSFSKVSLYKSSSYDDLGNPTINFGTMSSSEFSLIKTEKFSTQCLENYILF